EIPAVTFATFAGLFLGAAFPGRSRDFDLGTETNGANGEIIASRAAIGETGSIQPVMVQAFLAAMLGPVPATGHGDSCSGERLGFLSQHRRRASDSSEADE